MKLSEAGGTGRNLGDLLAQLPKLAADIAEGASERERKHQLPFNAFARFRASGLGSVRLPVSLGGPGGSLENLIDVIVTLAAADSNVAHALRLHYDAIEMFSLFPRSAFTETQLRRILDGAIFGGAAAERETAKPSEIQTTLKPAGEGFQVSGKKYYATGTAFSDYARVTLRDERGGYVMVVIPVTRAGVRIVDDWDGMGQRLTASGSLELDQVHVQPEEVLPVVFDTVVGRHCGALRQLFLVAVAAGIVRNIVSDALAYVRQHSRAVAHSAAATGRDDPFIQQVVGELGACSHVLDAMVRDNARVLERSAQAIAANVPEADELVLQGAVATAQTQLVAGKLALQAGERLFETGGASATSRARNFDRHWRNLRTIFNHNPLAQKARVLGDYHLNGVTTHLKGGRVF